MNPRDRLNVEYDAGAFDKDEQGYCPNHHRLRVEGDVLHVEQWGDQNGREPFSYAWQANILESDELAELAFLDRSGSPLTFCLRSQRLLPSVLSAEERIKLLTPPCFETAQTFLRWAASLFGLGDVANATQVADEPHLSSRRHSFQLRGNGEGAEVIAEADLIFDTPAAGPSRRLHAINLSAPNSKLALEWRSRFADQLVLRGTLEAAELRALRHAVVRAQPPLLVRPSLLKQALALEAAEVGSQLSYLDHGGGQAAYERIQTAAVRVRALQPLAPDAIAAEVELVTAFLRNPEAGWSALARVTPAHPELERLADLSLMVHLLAQSEGPADVAALAAAALCWLPAQAAPGLRQALVAARDGSSPTRELAELLREQVG